MIIIGLTGGIGSGKSTVSSYLQSLGIPVFDADASSRAAVKKGSACLRKIVDFFGPECLLETGELNRPWVADRVFHDRKLLKQYEKIVQDQVRADRQRFLEEQRAKGAQAVVLDVPLLIECGWYTEVDCVWLVSVPREMQIRRAMQRDHSPEETVTARIDAQMSLADKKRYADVVIDNSGTLEHTKEQAAEELRKLGIATEKKNR
ncbi:MAG: dephospho-CoA kinase [Acidaminococcaceae bacterium]|nr:dephospho-CoA kinase [Acidaminococcaceae bacterium]